MIAQHRLEHQHRIPIAPETRFPDLDDHLTIGSRTSRATSNWYRITSSSTNEPSNRSMSADSSSGSNSEQKRSDQCYPLLPLLQDGPQVPQDSPARSRHLTALAEPPDPCAQPAPTPIPLTCPARFHDPALTTPGDSSLTSTSTHRVALWSPMPHHPLRDSCVPGGPGPATCADRLAGVHAAG